MAVDITLLINLSAGDAAYCYAITKALATAHQPTVKEAILVIDTIKAPFVNFYDHTVRYAEPKYTDNLNRVKEAAHRLKSEGLVDRIIELTADDQIIPKIAKKYFDNWIRETHDFRGAPITAYGVGLEACKTRYVIHYDGDILLHQTPGSDWVLKGISCLEQEPHLIAVSPRPAPPAEISGRAFHDISWFSTRCLLLNLDLLKGQVPLVAARYLPEILSRKILGRTYPPAFETILTNKLKTRGLMTRYLLEEPAWYLHPEDKGKLFLSLLPKLLNEISDGKFPADQSDKEALLLDAWNTYFKN